MCSSVQVLCQAWHSNSSQPGSVTQTFSFRIMTVMNLLYSSLPDAFSFESLALAGQYRCAEAPMHTGGNWWKSPHIMTLMPLNGKSSVLPLILSYMMLSIVEMRPRSAHDSMEYLSMMRYLTFFHAATSFVIVTADGLLPLMGMLQSECNIALPITHAAILVYAPFKSNRVAPNAGNVSVTSPITFNLPVPPSPVSCMRSGCCSIPCSTAWR